MVMFPISLVSVTTVISYCSVCVAKKMLKVVKSDLCEKIIDFSYIKAERICLALWLLSLVLFSGFAMKNQVISAAGFCMLYILSAFYVTSFQSHVVEAFINRDLISLPKSLTPEGWKRTATPNRSRYGLQKFQAPHSYPCPGL